MELLTLNEAKIKAGVLCGKIGLDVDVYKTDEGLKVKHTYLRNGKSYLLRATRKKNQITITDEKGKIVEKIDLAKAKQSEKKSEPGKAAAKSTDKKD